MEDNAVILDYLPLGYVNEDMSTFKRKPIAQAIGIENFTLLELIPKEGLDLEIHENVFIGKDKEQRDKIGRVKGKFEFEKLTATSRVELDYVIREIIESNSTKFIKFFNESGSINTRIHQLELLPGIGKKHMLAILEAREKQPFESFEDIKERVPLLKDPVSILVQRVKIELDNTTVRRGKNKYTLFTYIQKEGQDQNKRRNRPQKRNNNGRNNRRN
ncbi:DUF655 domain-containing protein [Methanobrevibacter curvatus]|uniref:Uncharacterized protein n=1 Tax=Methanobrevibacter curvatus TaxID=49547 RepID=A0A166DV62_9EURY|nr:DUF655 domain-containing protein [Methanobrevibacter curvatus]KZX15985.1 hypothetical protein MBCUR_01610 [Methanobrevibacter curvatus]